MFVVELKLFSVTSHDTGHSNCPPFADCQTAIWYSERFIFWIRRPVTLCTGGFWWTSLYGEEKLVSVCQRRKTTILPRAVHAIISPLTVPTGFQMSCSLSHIPVLSTLTFRNVLYNFLVVFACLVKTLLMFSVAQFGSAPLLLAFWLDYSLTNIALSALIFSVSSVFCFVLSFCIITEISAIITLFYVNTNNKN